MAKFMLPLFFSGLNMVLPIVSCSYLVISIFVMFSWDFTQMIFLLQGLIKPMIVLTFWVSGMMALGSMPSFNSKNSSTFLACIFFLNFFLVMAFCSKNIMSFYLYLESTLIPTLLMVFGWGNQPERLQASKYLLIYTVLGSLPLLVGVSFIMARQSICNFFVDKAEMMSSIFLMVMMLGFLVKMPMYPVHLWLPKAHVEAPLAGSMALAGVLLKLGAFGMLMVIPFLSPSLGVSSVVSSICLWGSVVTSVICFRQTDMKSLIAYSSIGHMGLVLAGVLSRTDLGVKGAVIIVVAHGLSSPAMLNFANIVYECSFSRSMIVCKGIISIFPAMCMVFFLVCSSNMSAPPSINLVGEIFLIISVISFSTWIYYLILVMCLIVGVYTLYVYTSVSHGSSPSLSNSGHLLNMCNLLVMFMQLWPIGFITVNLYCLL